MIDLVSLIPFFPLTGAILNGVFGKRFAKNTVSIVACGSVLFSFLFSIIISFTFIITSFKRPLLEVYLYKWIGSGDFNVYIGFMIDPLSLIMMLVVTGVGLLIHIYSIGYMHEDTGYARYFSYLNLFTASMLILVMANNFLVMFIGWEGVGLCSYLLIGFWYEKTKASDAGKKAFIVNRIGDFGFIISMLLIFYYFGTLDIPAVFHLLNNNALLRDPAIITPITLLLFLGATGKSAQIPLYTWLPDAMEGPTPVSALIHAATMVTAGVYMVARCSALYLLAPTTMLIISIIGCLTAFFAATIALVQNDIKKVLAYSTISQLGFMFLACGIGAFDTAIFHLFTHAFFKACLFLCAGSIIHALAGEQDIEKMGGLKRDMPKTYLTFMISTLAISGIPPFAGFFSKDEILYNTFTHSGFLLWLIAVITSLLTSFYMFRLFFKVFFGQLKSNSHLHLPLHEAPNSMVIPLLILAFLSSITGFVGIPFPEGFNIIKGFLAPVFAKEYMSLPYLPQATASAINVGSSFHNSLKQEIIMMIIAVLIAIVGIFTAYQMYIKENVLINKILNRFSGCYSLLLNKYYIDELYDRLFVMPIKERALYCWKGIDDGMIDFIVNYSARSVKHTGEVIRFIQTGYARHYILTLLIGMTILLTFFL